MDKHRWLIEYCYPLNWCARRRLAPFIVWAETEELAIAYAAQWVGPPQPGENVFAYYWPSGALAA